MGKVKFDYSKVSSQTKSIKSSARENLKSYAASEYNKLKESMETSSGDYKTYLTGELEAEKNAVKAAGNFIIKLQEMMKATADAFQETDASYASGAVISGK